MAKKGVFPVIATIAIVGVVVGVFSQTVLRDASVSTNTMTSEQAYADLSSKTKRIGVQEVSVNPQQLDVSEFLDAKDELPDIESSYPFVIAGNGDVNIEIFSSGEKAAETGSDSFLTSMAKKFNAQRNTTSDGKTMSVSLRSVPSGTAAEYISTGKYQPECYTPSNTLFGELVKNEGVELTVETDRLVGNVAGILVSKKTGDMLRADYSKFLKQAHYEMTDEHGQFGLFGWDGLITQIAKDCMPDKYIDDSKKASLVYTNMYWSVYNAMKSLKDGKSIRRMIDALPNDGDKIGNLGYKYFNDALLSYEMSTD